MGLRQASVSLSGEPSHIRTTVAPDAQESAMTDFQEGDSLSPVLTITSGPLPDVGVVLVRFDFLANAGKPALEEVHAGQNFVLTPVQARHLVERLQRSLTRLETEPLEPVLDTVH